MVHLILDFKDIPKESINNNVSYYYKKSIIPINSNYHLHLYPYYTNSPYKYRDFFDKDDFNKLLNLNREKKPISHKKYNMGTYYIPELNKGSISNYEIVPVITNKYNIIKNKYKIKNIVTISRDSITNSIYNFFKIKYGNIYEKNNPIFYNFIASSIEKNKYYNIIKWKPLQEYIIDNYDYYEIDISDFINNDTINLMLICEIQ
uniref:Uncharacterized protein n=1 Tax=viral metagenome TaxID=1070528 RepID=A0A6C0JEY3_9ZZZZ